MPDIGPLFTRRGVLSSGIAGISASAIPMPAFSDTPARRFHHAEIDGSEILVRFDHRDVRVQISREGVASIIKAPRRKLQANRGFFFGSRSEDLNVRTETRNDTLRLVSDQIIVEVRRADGSIQFKAPSGDTRLAEAETPLAAIAGVPITDVQGFQIGDVQGLYGLGQLRDPEMDYYGKQIFLQHANMDAISPFLVSTAGWGLLWETGTAAYMRSEGSSLSFHSIAGDVIRYHVVIGHDMDALIRGYRRLTGTARLLGKWAYGYWQSKERYQSDTEVKAVVDGYRSRGLPLDIVVLDWRYWGDNDHFSGMTFDSSHFPDPKGMIEHVHGHNAHIIASVWPAFGTATEIYKDLAAAGRLLPDPHWSGGRVFDVTAPDARAIYWKHIDRGLMSIGIDGLWTDGCEPEFMSTGNRYVTARSFAANGDEAAGPIVRNLLTYSYYQSRGLSEAMRERYPERRPCILTRSVYPGQQAFGAVTWSGDIFAGWQTLRNQIVAAMNMALAGNPHWTCDIGGFLVFHRYPDGLADPAYRELYVRWFQWGGFLPVFRAHGTDVPREVWQFGKPGDAVYDALVQTLRLRYALMPYTYSLAAKATIGDGTILRPLVMDYPSDEAARTATAQYGYGESLMVRVVDRPLEHATRHAQEFIPNAAITGVNAPAADVAFYEGADFDRLVSRDMTDDLKMSWFGDLPRTLRGKPYSARWTGIITAQETGLHEFVATAQGAVKLTFDGIVRINAEGVAVAAVGDANGGVSTKVNASDREHRFSIALKAGQRYTFILEQRQKTPDAVSLWVEWLTPSQRKLNTVSDASSVPVYLPAGYDWYDFSTKARHGGGRTIMVDAPLERMPIFARAGAIIPMTPGITYASERAGETELHVFAGCDGAFELYDDAGDGDGYLRGERSIVLIRWNERDRSLRFGDREGAYPAMPDRTRFAVMLHEGHEQPVRRRCDYCGKSIEILF